MPDADPAAHGRVRRPSGPQSEDGQQAPRSDRHPRHRHLRGDRRGRVVGGDRRVRAGQGRLLPSVLPTGERPPQPGHLRAGFAKLAPGAFARAFGRWMAGACEAAGLVPVAVDGKSARRAKRDAATGCLTVVSAWAPENRLALGQVAVPDGSSEVGAIPELLRTLRPGRCDRDHRCRRVTGRERPDHPGPGRARPAGRVGQPPDAPGGRRGCGRGGVRGGLRRGGRGRGVEFPTNCGQSLAVGLVMRPLVLGRGDVPQR